MRFLLALSTLAFVQADDAKTDVAKFQGTWSVIDYHNDGSTLTKDQLKTLKVTIKDSTLEIRLGNQQTEKFTFTINPKMTPKWFNLRPVEGTKVDMLGIYELSGDTLKVGLRLLSIRPKVFPNQPVRNSTLLVLKRDKDKK